MWWSCLPKFKECALDYVRPSPFWTSDSTWGPLGFSSDKLLQVQSPKKINFCHSNIPTWRQASVLLVQQSCSYAQKFLINFISKFLLCLLFHFPCFLSGGNLHVVAVVFHSDFCLASFLLFKSLLPMISFSLVT